MLRFLLALAVLTCFASSLRADNRPNILWITSEDNGPQLGCYGDTYATTPNIDALAARGLRYLNCWSNAPVCAPARTALIAGLYPTSTGSEHMRSSTRLPDGMLMYPQYLRAAGYYCTNNAKEDYNLAKPGQVWDDSSGKAHWKNRDPGQPFFAVFNITTSHESQVRARPHQLVHPPDEVPLPAYHPDTPEIRRDWAQYYDKLSEMDRQVGDRLRELDEAGLAENTIVFYYGDHGPGLPRSKRWPYNSGLHVPLVIHIPDKYAHLASPEYESGGTTDRLVSFVDFAPTLLSLAGVEPPEHFQGHAFLGLYAQPPREYLHGFRGRMDERYDLVRSVRDKRYVYIRNYMPHRIYGQYVSYMFEMPTARVWHELYRAGKLDPPQTYFWEPKPAEELYDLEQDPDEVHNLAGSPEHQDVLDRLRHVQQQWAFQIRDVGFLPENELHTRSEGRTPYELGHDPAVYPLRKIIATAELASRVGGRSPQTIDEEVKDLLAALQDEDSAVRFWAATGLLIRGASAVRSAQENLRFALEDSAPAVRVVAAEALGKYGELADQELAMAELVRLANVQQQGLYVAMYALNALDELEERAKPLQPEIAALPTDDPRLDERFRSYVPRLIEKILSDLGR